MSIEEIRKLCNELKGVTEDIKWEDHLCFNIGGKMFLVTSPDKVPPSASFKVKDEEFDELTAGELLEPAAYLARYKWVYIDDVGKLTHQQWRDFIHTSYQLIHDKLSKKVRNEIGSLT